MHLVFEVRKTVNVHLTDTEVMMLDMCWDYNEKIKAIKYIRASRGEHLKEAKDIVDAYFAQKTTVQHWSTKYLGEHDCMTRMNQEAQRNSEPSSLGKLLRERMGAR